MAPSSRPSKTHKAMLLIIVTQPHSDQPPHQSRMRLSMETSAMEHLPLRLMRGHSALCRHGIRSSRRLLLLSEVVLIRDGVLLLFRRQIAGLHARTPGQTMLGRQLGVSRLFG